MVGDFPNKSCNMRNPLQMRKSQEVPGQNIGNETTKMIFIIKGFRTIVLIFIVISTTFRPICLLAFFRCLSNSGTFTELRTSSFIESTEFACSGSVSHNRVQALSILALLLACSQDWTFNLQMIVSLEI